MPSNWAAAAPRTQSGSCWVAALRKRPWARLVPAAAGRPRLGGFDAEGVGVDGGNQRAAVDAGAGGARGLDGIDPGEAADHRGGVQRQFGGLAAEPLAVLDRQQVGAQRGDLRVQPGGGGGGKAEDGDDRCDANGDPQGRQGGAQPAGPQPYRSEPTQVGGPQPGRARAGGRVRAHDSPPVSEMILPSSIRTCRFMRAAMAGSWVTMTMLVPSPAELVSRPSTTSPDGGVEVAGRLVRQQHRRRPDDRPRYRRPAAARRRTARAAGAQRGARGRPSPALPLPGGGAPGEPRRGRADPLPRCPSRHALEQEELLEHEPDALRTLAGERAVAHPRDVDGAEQHPAGRRPVERAEDVQQRRLA